MRKLVVGFDSDSDGMFNGYGYVVVEKCVFRISLDRAQHTLKIFSLPFVVDYQPEKTTRPRQVVAAAFNRLTSRINQPAVSADPSKENYFDKEDLNYAGKHHWLFCHDNVIIPRYSVTKNRK